jgi:hypothetical protein
VVIHGHRGRRPNNSKLEELRAYVFGRVREPGCCDLGPTLQAEHLSRNPRRGDRGPTRFAPG